MPLLASGAVGQATQYSGLTAKSNPFDIAAGHNGTLFFTEKSANKIGRLNPLSASGSIVEFTVPTANSQPTGIVAGPDSELWFVESNGNKIGRMTTAGTFNEVTLTAGTSPGDISAGPDGNVWFCASGTSGKIGRINATTRAVTMYSPVLSGEPTSITPGPDGNLWMAMGIDGIAKVSTAGAKLAQYTMPPHPGGTTPQANDITAGPDGNMWLTDDSGRIGKVTTAGVFTMYNLPTGAEPRGITPGQAGFELWFADLTSNKVGRITTGGTATEYAVAAGSKPENVVSGPDGNVWATEPVANEIVRLADSQLNVTNVLARDDGFVGSYAQLIVVNQGRRVQWTFLGGQHHTATDTTGMGLFDTGNQSFVKFSSFLFNSAGTYPYHDTLHTALTASVQVPMRDTPGSTPGTFTLIWSAAAPPTNYVFDVQAKGPGGSSFMPFVTGTTATSGLFTPEGPGAYQFQARLRNTANGHFSGWSPIFTIKVP
jgi:virginiamycin B lyase